jgi:hypothetical protein
MTRPSCACSRRARPRPGECRLRIGALAAEAQDVRRTDWATFRLGNQKLKAYPYENGFEIAGNREGLREFARVCLALAELPEDDEEAKRLGNHYHFDEFLAQGLVVDGSTPFIVLYKPNL